MIRADLAFMHICSLVFSCHSSKQFTRQLFFSRWMNRGADLCKLGQQADSTLSRPPTYPSRGLDHAYCRLGFPGDICVKCSVEPCDFEERCAAAAKTMNR
jgi:hypothetical protein